MTIGSYQVGCDWDNSGGPPFTGTGEDVTGRTLDVTWTRGRDIASQLVGRSRAGICTIRLNNQSGDYSPYNTLGPLYGNLVPGRLVQISGNTQTGFPYTFPITFPVLWTGYIMSITPQPSLKGLLTCEIRAWGVLALINQFKVREPMQTSQGTGALITDLLTRLGYTGLSSVDTGQTTITRFWTDQLLGLSALRKVEETELGFVWEGKDGTLHFDDRQHRLRSPGYTSQATFSDAAGAALAYAGLEEIDALPYIFNDIPVTARTFTVAGVTVLWTLPFAGANSPSIDIGQAQDFWAQYPVPGSATNAVAVDAWTTPVATTDYTANSRADGTGTDLTASIAVAVSKFAQAMKVTLTNNATVKAYITLLQARGTAVTQNNPVTVAATDAASQTKYGKRTWSAPGEFVPSVQEATDQGLFLKSIYASPVPLLRMTVIGNRDSAHLAQAMLRDVGDRITVVATGRSKLGLSGDYFIEAEQHHIDSRRNHIVTWLLSDATKFSDFFVVDVSKLDTSTRLAY